VRVQAPPPVPILTRGYTATTAWISGAMGGRSLSFAPILPQSHPGHTRGWGSIHEETVRYHVGSILAVLAVLCAVQTHGQNLRSIPKPQPSDVRATKLESRLAEMLTQPAAKPVALPLGVQLDGEGRVIVLIEPLPGRPSTDVDIAGLEALGASVLARSRHLLRIAIPGNRLLEACEIPGINFISTPQRPNSHAVSEGVALTRANGYHRNGLLGAGVKVAVIDDGFIGANRLADELPATVRTRDFTGDGQYGGNVHGTACAEIVHDVAPEAELHLLRISDILDFENATDYCIAEDVDIVSFSNGFDRNGFGDGRGFACDLVNEAQSNGILWVNAAGNAAKNTYVGEWTDRDDNTFQDIFSSTKEILRLREVSVGDTVDVSLVWDDFPLTSQDYDLLLYRISGSEVERVAASQTIQRNSKPIENIEYLVETDATYGVAVQKWLARSTAIKLISFNHEFVEGTSAGSISVPADALGAYAVGAVSYRDWASSEIEDYSSRGPTADGRTKPDISAPAGVQTRSYPRAFSGTSAATPHVAGAAALLLSVEPSRTPNEMRSVIGSSARDAGSTGKDNTFGDGLMTLPSPPRFVEVDTPPPPPTIYAASGRVTLSGQSNHSGVTITFTRSSGSGTIPSPVQTTSNGSWLASGFSPGSSYRATPRIAGWVFDPGSLDFSTESTGLKFIGVVRFSVSGNVDLEGWSNDGGVTLTFALVSGSGTVPFPAETSSTGDWSKRQFQAGSTYKVTPGRDGWTFSPADSIFSGPNRELNFTGSGYSYSASGRARLADRSDHSGVRIAFTRIRGSGTIPPPVTTSRSGAWSQSDFQAGSTFIAVPRLAGWTFLPAMGRSVHVPISSKRFSDLVTDVEFQGTLAPYAISGEVELEGQSDHSGVYIVFTRVTGTGTTPTAIRTERNGTWRKSGLQSGTIYRATPTHDDWTFSPASTYVVRASSTFDFTGTENEFTVSGLVQLAGRTDHSGVAISFTLFSRTGTIPRSVRTTSDGRWTQQGFTAGSMYRATPTRSGWIFNPSSRFVLKSSSTMIDFDGSGEVTTSVQKVQLGNPYPSPFNGTVTLPISLGETTILTVEVVNLLGQRVISLQGGPLEPGEHVFTWRGTDRHGQRVTSGVYIVVVRFNGSTLTRRVLYLR
jgi:subtilisin family serine protease